MKCKLALVHTIKDQFPPHSLRVEQMTGWRAKRRRAVVCLLMTLAPFCAAIESVLIHRDLRFWERMQNYAWQIAVWTRHY